MSMHMSGHVLLTISDEAAAMLALSSGLAPFNDLLDPHGPEAVRVLSRARLEWASLPDGRIHVWWSLLEPTAWARVQERLEYLVQHRVDVAGVFYGASGDRLEAALELLGGLSEERLPAWSLTVGEDHRLIYGSPTLLPDDSAATLSQVRAALLSRVRNDVDFYQIIASRL